MSTFAALTLAGTLTLILGAALVALGIEFGSWSEFACGMLLFLCTAILAMAARRRVA